MKPAFLTEVSEYTYELLTTNGRTTYFGTKRLHDAMEEYGKEIEFLLRALLKDVEVTKKMEIRVEYRNLKTLLENSWIFMDNTGYGCNRIEKNGWHPYYTMKLRHYFKGDRYKMEKVINTLDDWMKSKGWNNNYAKFIIYELKRNDGGWNSLSDTIEISVPVGYRYVGLEEETVADYLPEAMNE